MQILMAGDIGGSYNTFIRSFGHEVSTCSTAETTLEACQRTFYPLIIVDLNLLAVDGLTLCRRIRSLPQGDQSMILVITEHDEPKDLRAALDAGADDYLTTPVNIDVLHTRMIILERQIWNRIQHKQLQEELSRYREYLEVLVEKRTAELRKINKHLRQEIAEYRHPEQIGGQKGLKLHEALEALERRLITRTLEHHHWHRGKTAADLGIPRRSLQRKMKKYGLRRNDQ